MSKGFGVLCAKAQAVRAYVVTRSSAKLYLDLRSRTTRASPPPFSPHVSHHPATRKAVDHGSAQLSGGSFFRFHFGHWLF
jgi:hypothetical protein